MEAFPGNIESAINKDLHDEEYIGDEYFSDCAHGQTEFQKEKNLPSVNGNAAQGKNLSSVMCSQCM